MSSRLLQLLAHPRLPWIAAAVAVVLTLPSLWTGLAVDDYIQRATLLDLIGDDQARGTNPLLTLFSFLPADADARAWLHDHGLLPWWSHPELRAAFLRPLSAATHVADYALWPDRVAVQHAHSLMWYGLAVLVIALVYRRVMEAGAAAGLAAMLFAMEDAHAMVAAWLANRNGLIALVFGGLALLLHVRWSQTRRRAEYVGAVALVVVGLLAAEATLGAVAYIVAWQLTLARGTLGQRVVQLLPYAVVIAVWRAVYSALGYGAYGSTLYVDPGRDPLGFVLAVLERAPVLHFSMWSQVPMDPWMFLPREAQLTITAVGLVTAGLLGVLLWPLLRRSSEARFWALGMLGALVPVCASFPMDRLTLYAGVGAFALLALLVKQVGWLESGPSGPVRRWRRWATGGLLVLHAGLALVLLPARTQTIRIIGHESHRVSDQATTDPRLADQTLIFINGVDLLTIYLPMVRIAEGGVVPRRIALLSSQFTTNTVQRLDPHTLGIRPDGGFLSHAGDCLLRDRTAPFELGERIEMQVFEVEIIELTADGRPAEALFHFDEPLESDAYRWVFFHDGPLEPFEVPLPGETVRVRPSMPGTDLDFFRARSGSRRDASMMQ